MVKRVLLLTVLIFSILFANTYARTTANDTRLACSLVLASYMQEVNAVSSDKAEDYALLRNINSVASQIFGSLSALLSKYTNKQVQSISRANWETLAFSIYRVVKQNRKNALYLLFLTQPVKKGFLQGMAEKNGWTMQSADTMFISFLVNKMWKSQNVRTLGGAASVFTMFIAKNLKNSDDINTDVVVQTVYALLSRDPARGIRQVYSKYIQHIYSYKTDPITYCSLFTKGG